MKDLKLFKKNLTNFGGGFAIFTFYTVLFICTIIQNLFPNFWNWEPSSKLGLSIFSIFGISYLLFTFILSIYFLIIFRKKLINQYLED